MTPPQRPSPYDQAAARRVLPISENHRRHIQAALGLIDDLLREWERYAAGSEDAGPLRPLRNDLNPIQRAALDKLVERLRFLLTELKRDLGLVTDARTVTSILPGLCAILWQTVAGFALQHLRAWGETALEFDAYREPRRRMIESLLDQVLRVVAAES